MMDKKEGKVVYASSKEGLGISGFTLSVMGLVFVGVLGFLSSLIGLIFCYKQQKSYKTKLGRAGIILGVIGLILSIGFTVLAYYLQAQGVLPAY